MSNHIETTIKAGQVADFVGKVDKEKKRIESQIRTAARKATGLAPLSEADVKAGRDTDHFRRECERLTSFCLRARGEGVNVVEGPAVNVAIVGDAE